MANILITGANGQLGTELQQRGFSILHDVFYTDIEELDITSLPAITSFIENHDIDTIINCAAYTAVDLAESNPERAALVNRDAVANLAAAATRLGCLLIHISTDYVFDGNATTPYMEKSPTNPLSVYGRTKLEGERLLKKADCPHIIIRTAWLYSPHGHNFLNTILRLATEKSSIGVVDDQYGSPTYAGDLADAIIALLERDDLPDLEGIYHFTNSGQTTWCQFAKTIIQLAGLDCQVNPLTTDQYPTPAHRPSYSVLDTTKISRVLGYSPRPWMEALQDCIAKIQKPTK